MKKLINLFPKCFCIILAVFASAGPAFADSIGIKELSASEGAAPSPDMSKDDAYGYVAKVFNDWFHSQIDKLRQDHMVIDRSNLRLQIFPDSLRTMAQKIAPMGLSNLLLVRQKITEQMASKEITTDTGVQVNALLDAAVDLSINDDSIPQIVEMAHKDISCISYIFKRKSWWHSPAVNQLLKDLLAGSSQGSASTSSAFDTLMSSGISSQSRDDDDPSSAEHLQKFKQSELQQHLFSMAFESTDPGVQDALNQAILKMAQNDNTDPIIFNIILYRCLSNDTYGSIVPVLFAALRPQLEKQKQKYSFDGSFFEFLEKNPKLCTDSQFKQALENVMDYNPSNFREPVDDKLRGRVEAFFGDTDSLQKVLQRWQDEEKNTGHVSHRGEDCMVLNSIVYSGPGNKVQGIQDNIDTIKFDTTTGKWTVTARPGYENKSTSPRDTF